MSTSLDKGTQSHGEPLAPGQPHTSLSFVSITSETTLKFMRDGPGWVTSSTLIRRCTRHARRRISRDSKTVPSQAAGRTAYLMKEWAECIVVRLPSWGKAQLHPLALTQDVLPTVVLSVPSQHLSVMNWPPLPLDQMGNF